MTNGLDHIFGDDVVYRRTVKGRAALLGPPALLSPAAAGFLARVNGFTDLRTLLDQDQQPGPQVAEAIGVLLAQALIEPVVAQPSLAAGFHATPAAFRRGGHGGLRPWPSRASARP